LVPDQALDVRQHLHLGERLVVGLEDDDVRTRRRCGLRLCGHGRHDDQRAQQSNE